MRDLVGCEERGVIENGGGKLVEGEAKGEHQNL